MSTHVRGFQSLSGVLHHFILAQLATRSIRIKVACCEIFFIENQKFNIAQLYSNSRSKCCKSCDFILLHPFLYLMYDVVELKPVPFLPTLPYHLLDSPSATPISNNLIFPCPCFKEFFISLQFFSSL